MHEKAIVALSHNALVFLQAYIFVSHFLFQVGTLKKYSEKFQKIDQLRQILIVL